MNTNIAPTMPIAAATICHSPSMDRRPFHPEERCSLVAASGTEASLVPT